MGTMIIHGYGQPGGGRCLVTVDAGDGERVLPMPELLRGEGRHSPDGFQWGYGGSGPAELARAILIQVFPDDVMVRHPRVYQEFKFDVVARLDREGFVLTDAEVRAWRAQFQAVHPEYFEEE